MAKFWRLCFCALALVSLSNIASAGPSGSIRYMEPYSVDGLGVGAPVAPDSWQYKRYKCSPSEQYQGSIFCKFTETKGGVSHSTTILHLYNNIVTYINKSLSPAFFTRAEVEREIVRLSERFGAAPKLQASRAGIIASWGDIELIELNRHELSTLADDENPNLGFMVDYAMNFHESARAGLPVYRLGGGKGFIWIARFAQRRKPGMLRFLAANPSQMRRATAQPEEERVDMSPAQETPPQRPESAQKVTSSGTGFFVSPTGEIVTNAHVVEGCHTAQIIAALAPPAPSRVVARDSVNDLALLKGAAKPTASATLRAGVKIGEEIAVFGYPLIGLLSTKGNFTIGNVSAIAGIGDDTRYIQISAPVQQGNSGGPVLDQRGAVVGVVVSKLNVLKVAEATQDVPQNVNFAIKATVLMNFLDANGVSYAAAGAEQALSSADLAERAKSISVLVNCERSVK